MATRRFSRFRWLIRTNRLVTPVHRAPSTACRTPVVVLDAAAATAP